MNRVCVECSKEYKPNYIFWSGMKVSRAKHCQRCIDNKAKIRWAKTKADPEHLERERARKREHYYRKKAIA